MKFRVLFLVFQILSFSCFADQVSHQVDLFALHDMETYGLSGDQIERLNQQTLAELENIPIPAGEFAVNHRNSRVLSVSRETAQAVIDTIEKNPVTRFDSYSKYNQPGRDLGFCFGRAAYVHILLLKMGVAKQSIKKLWLMGPMQAGAIMWGFHVAVAVKSNTGEWLMVDSVPGKLLNSREWVDHFLPMNGENKNLRVYVTEPIRFGTGPGLYSRLNFGLDLNAESDWYRHYFFDLMHWFKETPLSSLGLSRLHPLQVQRK